MSTLKSTYIGDGVYAHYQGYYIKLETDRGEGQGMHVIFIEPPVLSALVKFAKEVWGTPDEISTDKDNKSD